MVIAIGDDAGRLGFVNELSKPRGRVRRIEDDKNFPRFEYA